MRHAAAAIGWNNVGKSNQYSYQEVSKPKDVEQILS
jgi:hypothetical protein